MQKTGQRQRNDSWSERGHQRYRDLRRSPITLVSSEREGLSASRGRGRKTVWKQRSVVGTLILVDVALAFSIYWLVYLVQELLSRGPLTEVAVATIMPSVAAWIGMRALLGLYPGYGLDEVEELRRQTFALLVGTATVAVFALGFQIGDELSRLQFAAGFFGLLLLAPPLRLLAKWAMRHIGLWGKPVVVLGSRNVSNWVSEHLRHEWGLGYDPVAVFDFDPIRLISEGSERPLNNSSLEQVAELAREQGITTAVFAMPNTRREQLADLVGWAGVNFRHVLVIPNLDGVTNSAVVARDLAGTFAVEIKHNLLNPWALRIKRAFDLGCTVIGGVLILPLILVLLAVVFLESRGGPVFYKDERLGRDGQLFSCLKFRTMVPGAEEMLQRLLREDAKAREEYFEYHKLRRDPRVTRVGSFLRKTSLDELPQLWNVLKGEMSLVGPRPYLSRESDEIGGTQEEILRVPPGITGLWQVDGRNHASFRERIYMDSYYVRDWSIWLDIVILVRTFRTVIFGRGAY